MQIDVLEPEKDALEAVLEPEKEAPEAVLEPEKVPYDAMRTFSSDLARDQESALQLAVDELKAALEALLQESGTATPGSELWLKLWSKF